MSIAPWDWLPYFGIPVETHYQASTNPVLIAPADPMRVVLIIGVPQTGGAWSVSLNSNVTTSLGFNVSTSSGPLVFTQSLHGAIVAQAWYGQGGLNAIISVITQSMIAWPKERMDAYYEKATIPDAMERANQRIRQYISSRK